MALLNTFRPPRKLNLLDGSVASLAEKPQRQLVIHKQAEEPVYPAPNPKEIEDEQHREN